MATGSHSIKSSRAEPTVRNPEEKTKLGSHPKPQRRSAKKKNQRSEAHPQHPQLLFFLCFEANSNKNKLLICKRKAGDGCAISWPAYKD
ncbi:hypothetical protein AVEN_5666-1 [Araneus ventricosus]|uniref:Uncharacterized protein n=1 Tax=Araneus ventricosus TaxID=182803 RepID=A0A4Y2MWF4_ARAVE|nr:hypothetical protein AVEN_5666-1 [Araneus ventricosus]